VGVMHVRPFGFKFPCRGAIDMAVGMSPPRAANWLIFTVLLSCSGLFGAVFWWGLAPRREGM